MVVNPTYRLYVEQVARLFCEASVSKAFCENGIKKRINQSFRDITFESEFLPNLSSDRFYLLKEKSQSTCFGNDVRVVYTVKDIITGEVGQLETFCVPAHSTNKIKIDQLNREGVSYLLIDEKNINGLVVRAVGSGVKPYGIAYSPNAYIAPTPHEPVTNHAPSQSSNDSNVISGFDFGELSKYIVPVGILFIAIMAFNKR